MSGEHAVGPRDRAAVPRRAGRVRAHRRPQGPRARRRPRAPTWTSCRPPACRCTRSARSGRCSTASASTSSTRAPTNAAALDGDGRADRRARRRLRVHQPRRDRPGLRPPRRRPGLPRRAAGDRRRGRASGSSGWTRRATCWSSPPTTAATRRRPGTDHTREHVAAARALRRATAGAATTARSRTSARRCCSWLTGRDAPLARHAVSLTHQVLRLTRVRSRAARESTHRAFTGRHHPLDACWPPRLPHRRLRRTPRAARPRPRRRRPPTAKPKPTADAKPPSDTEQLDELLSTARAALEQGDAAGLPRRPRPARRSPRTSARSRRAKALPLDDVRADRRRAPRSTGDRATLRVDMAYTFDGIDTDYFKTLADDARRRRRTAGGRQRPAVGGRARAVGVHAYKARTQPHFLALAPES